MLRTDEVSPDPRRPLGAPRALGRVSVASFNLHAGVDGWGRPFDVVGPCRDLDADVLVLQEVWAPDDAPSLARQVADELGYTVAERVMARGRRSHPMPPSTGWGPTVHTRGERATVFLDSERPLPEASAQSRRYRAGERGAVTVAVLSRVPVQDVVALDLGRLARDGAHRWAVGVTVPWEPAPLTVVGTHMSHLSALSPIQLRRLARQLRPLRERGPVVVAGDMNVWGPPLVALLPGLRRAVKGRSWPAWRPHSQLDHILVSPDLAVAGASVGAATGSDHRPVWAELVPSTVTRR